ncbi:MAG: MBL fold metallo-hydrolase [Planctomycetaceae bacterium]|nr:MBL fold metallo-hydrolase [Planctomycetaceae bacterium]
MAGQLGEIVILGSGTSHGVPMVGCRCPVCLSDNPRNQRTRSSILVRAPEGNFIVDTTPEMRLQLVRERIDLVHAAVFTHGHADHIFGLDDLRQFGFLLDRDIPLYCEEPVAHQLRQAYSYAFAPPDDPGRRGAIPRFEIHRLDEMPIQLLGTRVRPIRLLHGKLRMLGFRIGNAAYCTDVSEIPSESWPLLEQLDVLIIDALRYRPHPTHFNIAQALEVVERVRPRRTFFTHICHDIEHETVSKELPAGVELAYDGLKIPIVFTD